MSLINILKNSGTISNIEKNTAIETIYLATDDNSLIYDDNDNTFLIIIIGSNLKRISKNISTLINIDK